MISLKGNKWLPWLFLAAGLGLVGTVGSMLFGGKKDQPDLETIINRTQPPIHQTTTEPQTDYNPSEKPEKKPVEPPIHEAIKNYDASILTPPNLLQSYYTTPSIPQSLAYFRRVATDMASMTGNDLSDLENWSQERKNKYMGLETEVNVDDQSEEGVQLTFPTTTNKLDLNPNNNPYGDLQVNLIYNTNDLTYDKLPDEVSFCLRYSENFNGLNPLLIIRFKDMQDSNGNTRTLIDYEVEGYIPAGSKTPQPAYTAVTSNTHFNETSNTLESMINIEPTMDAKFQINSSTDNLTPPEDNSSQAYLNWAAQRLYEGKKIEERIMPFLKEDKAFSDAMAEQLRCWAVGNFDTFDGLYKKLLEN